MEETTPFQLKAAVLVAVCSHHLPNGDNIKKQNLRGFPESQPEFIIQ
jgi:hypothetical protein